MAKKKGSSNEFEENPDEASVEVVAGDDDAYLDEPVEESATKSSRVNIKQPKEPEPPEVGAQTKAEMEAGKKAVEDSESASKDQAKKRE